MQNYNLENRMRQEITDCMSYGQEIDICELCADFPLGIGYNELRYCWIDEDNNLVLESNNVHDWTKGEDVYKKYYWNELTDYEKDALYKIFLTIGKENQESLGRMVTCSIEKKELNNYCFGNAMPKSLSEQFDQLNDITILSFKKSHNLLNPTKLTNFEYKLSKNLPQETVEKINSMITKTGSVDIKRRVRAIEKEGCSMDFFTISPNAKGDSVFFENLILIDSSLPNIIAHLLKLSYTEETKVLDALTDKLTNDNPLGFPMKSNKKYYEAKIKRFITDVALGMVPSQPWEATPQASGMLVVKDSGDIDCFHVIYKSALEEYLYHDLKFETASATRHEYGYIYTGEDGNQYFKLNLQLRFIK